MAGDRPWHELWEGTDFGGRLERARNDPSAEGLLRFIAEKLVHPSGQIVLSTGATMSMLARAILDRAEKERYGRLGIITPNLEVILECLHRKNEHVQLIVPQGSVHQQAGAINFDLEGFQRHVPIPAIDLILMSFAGFQAESGFFDAVDTSWVIKEKLLATLDRRRHFLGNREVCIVLRGTRLGVYSEQLSLVPRDFTLYRRIARFHLASDRPKDAEGAARFDAEVAKLTEPGGRWALTAVNAPDDIVLLRS
jgi:hypothetical protein